MTAASVVRGCGTRQPGGIYLVASLGEDGIPLRECVIDPPAPVNAAALGLSPQGMALGIGASTGRIVVLDWVGAKDYPNVADFIEEVALFGSSRRVPATFAFDKLGPGATHVLCHPHAVLANRSWLNTHIAPWAPENSYLGRLRGQSADGHYCPFKGGTHPADVMCAAFWWETLAPGTVTFDGDIEAFQEQCDRERLVTRRMPSFAYEGYTLPDRDQWVPEYLLGAFLGLPLTRIEVVTDPGDMAHVEALDRASKSGLPVVEVGE